MLGLGRRRRRAHSGAGGVSVSVDGAVRMQEGESVRRPELSAVVISLVATAGIVAVIAVPQLEPLRAPQRQQFETSVPKELEGSASADAESASSRCSGEYSIRLGLYTHSTDPDAGGSSKSFPWKRGSSYEIEILVDEAKAICRAKTRPISSDPLVGTIEQLYSCRESGVRVVIGYWLEGTPSALWLTGLKTKPSRITILVSRESKEHYRASLAPDYGPGSCETFGSLMLSAATQKGGK